MAAVGAGGRVGAVVVVAALLGAGAEGAAALEGEAVALCRAESEKRTRKKKTNDFKKNIYIYYRCNLIQDKRSSIFFNSFESMEKEETS